MKKKRAENGARANPTGSPAGDSTRRPDGCIELRLYTTGLTPLSVRAVSNIRRLCEVYLDGNYALEIIDIVENPTALKEDQVIAAPTLIKVRPLPARRFIGDMSATDTILKGLDIEIRDGGSGGHT